MNTHLQHIVNIIQQDEYLSAEQKSAVLKSLKDADKELEIATFKLDRTEKIKRTTAILLEETIAELEQKRKAVEDQNRELEIETAVERVRAEAMAMHSTEDFGKVAQRLLQQVQGLGIKGFTGATIYLVDESELITGYDFSAFGGLKDAKHQIFRYDANKFPLIGAYPLKEWKKGTSYFELDFDLEKLQACVKELEQINLSIANSLNEALASGKLTHQWAACGRLKNGFIAFDMITPPNEDVRKITIKMSYAFDQAYTRFLDLQKAEAQAREAQIEAALEKVRSRTMAMQRSEELPEVAALLFQQVKALGVPQFHCGFNIFEIDDKECTWYPGSADGDILPPCKIPLTEHPVFMNFIESRKRGDELCVYEKEGEYQAGHYRYMLSLPVLGEILQNMLDAGIPFPTFQIDHLANFSHGNLLFITSEHFPEMHDTFKRFAKVFEQTYTRFLDLQKAEAQAREAQIEAALEKVRSRTMAMQRSEELSETAAVLFQEFKKFGNSDLIQTTIGIYHEEQGVIEFRVTDWAGGGNQIGESFLMSMEEPIVLKPAVTAWKAKEKSFVADLTGKELEGWINYRNKMTGVTISSADTRGRRIITLSFFSKGHLSISSPLPLPEKTISTLERFASVFDGTYTRFLDLQKAETQAKVAIKQSSLDRIRGEIASMRTTKDLERITPLIWKELTTLNIPFIRCGVFIMDEMMQQIHTFLSTPDGKAIAAFHLPYDAPGRTREILAGWINKQAYIEHWDEADFSELGDLLVQQGALPSKDVYMKTIPAGGLYLHCLPFLQGMLYVGNTIALKEDDIQLIQSIADAFATAYARYEDFNKLEAAKQQVDKALVELKQTQQQLVQSEKMASLGELTAGIAHEIQNPLNFVNNFSEVSTELVKEMVEEAEKGNSEEVIAIAYDVTKNLEKINHHGKRAADIVKGMLQHSRTSSGQKELTNINELADEYLRLAYHGLRAKDKSFNAKFETYLDPNLPKLNVIPQDIGRVLLNLINNAFYAVSLRHSKGVNSYQPTVWVSTKNLGDKIEISVKDNGNGIPDSIKEKIFQPFFTTKPTGQGTGLGLSLSYDIVKAHGGELKVETKEGVGSVFVIQLPIA